MNPIKRAYDAVINLSRAFVIRAWLLDNAGDTKRAPTVRLPKETLDCLEHGAILLTRIDRRVSGLQKQVDKVEKQLALCQARGAPASNCHKELRKQGRVVAVGKR